MTHRFALSSLLVLAAAGCQPAATTPAAAPALTEADANAQADAMVAVWESKDAAKIKSLYTPDVVAFDYAYGPLETDRATFDKAQDVFAAAEIDKETQVSRKIQILSADTFIVSGVWDGHSNTKPASNGLVRCTDVFHKDAAGTWMIVNEHCSAMPKTV